MKKRRNERDYPRRKPERPAKPGSGVALLLRLLEEQAGAKVKRKELIAGFNERAHRTGAKRKSFRDGPPDDPNLILTELELLGLLQPDGRNLKVRDPFSLRARLSFSPRGMAFAVVRGGDPMVRDVFVSAGDLRGALPGDEVELRLRDRRRDRFGGSVIRVLRRARSEYRLQIIGPVRRGTVPAVLLDSPTRLSAVLLTDRLPADTRARLSSDTVVIGRLSGRRLNDLGGYSLEADFVRFEADQTGDVDLNRVLMKYNLDVNYPTGLDLPGPEEQPDGSLREVRKSRKDLRHLDTITIDGEDSKDFDDALSLEARSPKSKTVTLYIHIADVAHYVQPGTALDDEARERATSVYLPGCVVPMLPPVLSEDLCSLRAGIDRFAFTAELTIARKSGKITKADFYKSLIEVDRRWTYQEAESALDGVGVKHRTAELVRDLWEIAQAQRASRMASGRIDLDIPESVPVSDPASDRTHYVLRERLRSSLLIEECMLSANIAVAAFMRKKGAPTLYRVHEPMDTEKLERLNFFFQIYNIDLELKDISYAGIQRAQELVAAHPDRASIERIFNIVLLRSFMQARYQREPLGHWGLGFEDYSHFTSPIRRYPDLVVHRVLERLVRRKSGPYDAAEVDDMGAHCSDRERGAMDAERDMTKLRMLRVLEDSGRTRLKGFVTGFRPDRVFIELADPPVEAVVKHHHLTNESELILPNDFSVYIKKLSRPAFLGEEWDLELEDVDPELMAIFVRPVWPQKKKGAGQKSGNQKGGSQKGSQGNDGKRKESNSKRKQNSGGRKTGGSRSGATGRDDTGRGEAGRKKRRGRR